MGVLTALLYEPICFFKAFIKNKIIRQVVDFAFFLVPFMLYLDLSLRFCFPSFRLYMFFGIVLGFYLVYKSFHKTLAKVYSVVYNKTISFIRRKNRDGRKKTEVNSSRYGNIGDNAVRFNRRFGISAHRHRCKNKAEKRPRCRKSKA
ncbi:MAG: spore cortex biosynthesis protein YabQ [Clostridia bacterium]|nr:spore cortex biosynthesis protein YabQ [Clostridia bacterium]